MNMFDETGPKETPVLITQEEINRIVSSKKSEIVAAAIQSIIADAKESLEWTAKSQIQAELSSAIGDVIKDEIVAQSETLKTAVREAVISVSSMIGPVITNALLKQASENLSKSWNLSKITEAMFK
jgi:hypothetical protein